MSLEINGAFPPLYKIGSLFFAVWGIYLFDRIFDSFRFPLIEETPRRHLFAKKHREVLFALSAAAAIAAGIFILPHVSLELVKAALFPAILCFFYFVVFRFVKGSAVSHFPVKELVIGFCFASGVMVAAETRFSAPSSIVIETALSLLFAGNCLIIGQAESEFDRKLDGASFYGKSEKGNWIPATLFAGTLILSALLASWAALPLIAASTFLCALFQFASQKRAAPEMMQPLADGALLLPWIVLLFFQ